MSVDSSKTSGVITPPLTPWRPWQGTVAALAVFVVAQLAIFILLQIAGINIDSLSVVGNIILGLFSSGVSLALAWWFASWFSSDSLGSLGFVRPKRNIWPFIGLGMIIFVLASSLVSTVVDKLWPGYDAEQIQDLGLGEPTSYGHYMAIFLLLVVAAPIVEEVVFRGLLFGGWRSRGFLPAAIFSSLLFGLFHWQPNVVLATIVLGWIMAYLYEKTGSLWAPIGLHALKNAMAFAIVYGVGIS